MPRPMNQISTKLIHAGEPEPRINGAVAMPVFQSSTFELRHDAGYHDMRYIRLNNTPNHAVLHAKLAALEGAEAGLVTASGMAAISTALLTVLRSGDHLLAQSCLYGGTHDFVTQDLERFGISYTLIDAENPASWAAQRRPNTRAIYAETITNPLMQVGDLRAMARFAREQGLVSLIDNSLASPINFRPVEHGFDVVLHSCTKFLNGHNDIVGGAVVGRADMVEAVRHRLNHLGGAMDPHACFLLNRGIKTLAVRLAWQNQSALQLARFLADHARIARVNYPGLESHASHRRARELLSGFGGILSFEVKGGADAARRLLEHVTIPIPAPSLGGTESLITLPAFSSHAGMTAEGRRQAGIPDGLVRLSVGLEGTEDLIADLDQALSA